MKTLISMLIALSLTGCKKDEAAESSNDLVGTWLQSETYVNPGSGGSWVPVAASDAGTIRFSADGTVVSSLPLYSGFTNYNISKDSLEFTNTAYKQLNGYSISDNRQLTLIYPCREGCGYRFIRQ